MIHKITNTQRDMLIALRIGQAVCAYNRWHRYLGRHGDTATHTLHWFRRICERLESIPAVCDTDRINSWQLRHITDRPIGILSGGYTVSFATKWVGEVLRVYETYSATSRYSPAATQLIVSRIADIMVYYALHCTILGYTDSRRSGVLCDGK